MDSVKPLVSVVIPAYNAARTLLETLRSASAQTYSNLEIIVVDDGSTDETCQIVRDFARHDSRVQLISQANGGVARARNTGIAAAAGELIAPLDADDLWHPTKIEKQVATLLAAGPQAALCYSPYRRIDEAGDVRHSSSCSACEGWVFHQHLHLNFVGNGSSPIIRKDVLVQFGGYDPSLRDEGHQGCEDYLLQLRIARRWQFACVPEYLVGYRRMSDSMSAEFANMVGSFVLAYRKIRQEASVAGRPTVDKMLCRYLIFLARARLKRGKILEGLNAVREAFQVHPGKASLAVANVSGDSLRLLTRKFQALKRKFTASKEAAKTPRRKFESYSPTEVSGEPMVARSRRRVASLQLCDTGPDG
jgi:glycosyltransferase involved in cell wall biosynthesis